MSFGKLIVCAFTFAIGSKRTNAQLIHEVLGANLEPNCDVVSGSATGKLPPPIAG